MAIPYIFHRRLVLRTPSRPFQARLDGFDLDRLCRDTGFLEAIYLASPVLHAELTKYRDGGITDQRAINDLHISAGKYFLRMSSRSTPFGLFSGCSVADWSAAPGSLVLAAKHNRHTRIDMHVLCALAQYLTELPGIREGLLYYPNSSCYRIGEELRYVEYNYVAGKRYHQLSAVAHSADLSAVLDRAETGVRLGELAALLAGEGHEPDEAQRFVEELAGAQVLVSELEPAITGEEFLPQLIRVLERIGEATGCARLRELHARVGALDVGGTNEIASYQAIKALITQIGVAVDEAKLFQTDLAPQLADSRVSETVQAGLLEALDILNAMQSKPVPANLRVFIRRFTERYEQREVPLVEALDVETGIGYLEHFAGDIVPLIADVAVGADTAEGPRMHWGKQENWLMGKLTEALADGAAEIELSKEDMPGLENDWEQLPPSLAVLFRPLADGRFLLEGSGGSSAISMLCRFAHGNPAIGELVREIVATEEAFNPDIIFAEVVHLPESRTGNVLMHPVFRRYEIPFLARASVEPAGHIRLSDLLVSVQGGRIVLRSKRLNKEIIPRLSNAHNWMDKGLPVYQFLCDLQTHNKQSGIGFRWGALENRCRFLPRVVCRDFVVSAARWNFGQPDIAYLKHIQGAAFDASVRTFRQRWRLPAEVLLADGDNELYLNLDDPHMVSIWWDAVRNRSAFILKEFLAPGGAQGVRDAAGCVYAGQLLAVLLRTKLAYEPVLKPKSSQANVSVLRKSNEEAVANFSLGSEWLYVKIYCGERTADQLLVACVHPLVTGWLEAGQIDRFFFLRYSDPGFHVRLRVHLSDISALGSVLRALAECIRPFEIDGRVWKVQFDTYQRELERYGQGTIGLAEEFFFHDSLAVLEMLSASAEMDRESMRWLWALRSIDELLDGLGWSLMEKREIAEHMKEAYHREFKADKVLRSQLSTKYRNSRRQLEDMLDRSRDAQSPWRDLLRPLNKRQEGLLPVAERLQQLAAAGRLEVPLRDLLCSYVHMLVNRVVSSDPRKHELVLYDLLFTHYRSVEQRVKYQDKNDKKIHSAAQFGSRRETLRLYRE